MDMDDDDVPPLEDLSDAVRRARALQTQVPDNPLSRTSGDESRMRSRNGGAAKEGIAVDQSKSKRLGKSATKLGEAEERRGASSRAFGGFAKGFLLSESSNSDKDISKSKPAPKSQSNTEEQVKKKYVSSLADADSKGLSVKSGSAQSSVSTDDNVPFLRMNKKESKGPVFPEVQEAMKEAYPLLNTQEWLTESLLEKMEKHPVLSKALHDPQLAQVMSQFQSNPKAVLQAAAGNPEVQEFLKEFCALMGDHFSDLADKEEEKQSPKDSQPISVDKDVEKALSQKGVKEALTDPQIQQLIGLLREDPVRAQRLLSSAGPELHRKVQLLIDNGLLAFQ